MKPVPENLLDMESTKLARLMTQLIIDIRNTYNGNAEITFNPEWNIQERFLYSKLEFQKLFNPKVSNSFGLDAFLRQPGFEVFNKPIFKQHLVKAIATRRLKSRPSMWCRREFYSEAFVKQHVKRLYNVFPLTLKSTDLILEAIGQKRITRSFKKQWVKGANPLDYHYFRKGSVGNGNGCMCFLTVEGYFDILYKRVRTTALRDRLFKLYQKVNQQIRLASEQDLKEQEFFAFGTDVLKRE
jgi:hypothetical protein